MAEIETSLFGRSTSFEYSTTSVGVALLALRTAIGWLFLYAGMTKVLDPDWSAKGYLGGVSDANPLGPLWGTMATDFLWLIDPLNAWGAVAIGVALLLGFAVRFSAFWGATMMLFYWASSLPLAHAVVVDQHVVYVVVLFGLGAFGAGRVVGLDAVLERTDFVQERPRLRYLLG